MNETPAHAYPWARAALWRRALLALLVLIPSVVASEFMVGILPHPGFALIDDALAIVFGLLFGWVSIGLWTSVFGAAMLLFGARRWVALAPPEAADRRAGGRTAVIMPAYREQPERVAAGLEVMYRSLRDCGRIEDFDFFLLSDSDEPDAWVDEEIAWVRLRQRLGGAAKVFYRRRRNNIKRKSGNVADFCRRWGAHYEFMVVLDADSLMSGETLASLADAMRANPGVGLIQTVPSTVRQNSLFGRLQQFANRLYGPVFSAGMHFWQLGEGHYWGHNAIIRIEPFMRHCALPRLPGKGMLGGDILSHDFVEAALLRRAGWSVWLAHDLDGSYEEAPPTLLDELKRDRRWAQGNLQHMRLLFASGLNPAHRAVFLNGIMAYVSSLLWFVFLLLSSLEAVLHALIPPDYFPDKHVLFPVWPVWHPHWAVTLAGFTLAVLFLPKVLAVLVALIRGRAREFGGPVRLVASAVVESVFSVVLAPVRMLFHTLFVLAIMLGRQVRWGTQTRGDASTGWRDALRHHAPGTLLGLAWATAVYLLSPGYFWWLIPVMGAWVIAIPVSVWTSRVGPGVALRRAGILLTPEEVTPPPLLAAFQTLSSRQREDGAGRGCGGFVAAVVDPGVNAMHCALLRDRTGSISEEVALSRRRLLLDALKQGPDALDRRARMQLLVDGAAMRELHWRVWSLREEFAQRWRLTVTQEAE
ncbi:glucans biosynthesis glucosyltransferase MdoH [Acidihalobacter prosperus]|uniref:Glucans biosynthesis glucosyltransferase H n=1 Tax=Acidihalobacter prosperus TaxID=160660 RepID=A0A1A6C6M8_9GAMM|nr:glucans biosynthesis glucosyltransferase MdoH [Acidihalobacter prosperus]OBS10200.1 glucan biosynthesis glucosyltransferase H [Acidihalobacter prosperus]